MLHRNHFFILSLSLLFTTSVIIPLTAEEIATYVVTASRESETVMDAPALVTVITAEEIKKSGKTSIIQILESVPGILFRSYSGESDAQVSMRGFGENSFGRVVVLVDGKRLNNPDMQGLNWQSIPTSSIERIEVLDGPSAVLYGSGAVGGVINIITKESADGITAEAAISYGSFETSRVQINAGMGSESAGFLVSADHYRSHGYRNRSANINTNVNAQGFVDITDKLTVKPSFSYADIYYQMPGSLTKAQFVADPTQATNLNDDGTERDFGGGVTALFNATDNLNIELPLNYTHKDRKAEMPSYANITFAIPESHTNRDQHQFEAKPKTTYTADTKIGELRLTGGFDFDGAILNVQNFSDRSRTIPGYAFDISQFSYAPYFSAKLKMPIKLAASAGVRYNYATINAKKDSTLSKINAEATYQNCMYDILLSYYPSEAVSFYTKFNTLFRFPFVDEKAALTGYYDKFNTALKPETGYNAELGAKYRLNEFLIADFNAYVLMMQDEIAYNSTNHQNENLKKTQRFGGNMDVSVTPAKFVTINGNASYVNATFVEGDKKGTEIPLAPSFNAYGETLFNLPQGINLGLDLSFTGPCNYEDADNALKEVIDPYLLMGLSMKFSPLKLEKKLSIGIRIDNLLDTKYAPYYATGYQMVAPWAYVAYYPAAGRSFTISASYTY